MYTCPPMFCQAYPVLGLHRARRNRATPLHRAVQRRKVVAHGKEDRSESCERVAFSELEVFATGFRHFNLLFRPVISTAELCSPSVGGHYAGDW